MNAAEQFVDTNVLLYLLSADSEKAHRAEKIVSRGGTISVQVLNEFAAVALRRLNMTFPEIRDALRAIRGMVRVVPLNEATHDTGLRIAQRYRLSIYDATLIAAAMLSDCRIFVSEDLQHGQEFEGNLRVRNPFL